MELILRTDPRSRNLKSRTGVGPHTVDFCECGAPIVYLTSARGYQVPCSPEMARGNDTYHGNLVSHYDSCPNYKKHSGKNRHPLSHTIPSPAKYGRTCLTCGLPDCYSHNPYQFAGRE